MAEYIEREAAIAAIYDIQGPIHSREARALRELPAADVVEVVRCKDCKKYHAGTGWCDEHSHFIDGDRAACHPWESAEWKMFNPDDSCSYGERKDGEG